MRAAMSNNFDRRRAGEPTYHVLYVPYCGTSTLGNKRQEISVSNPGYSERKNFKCLVGEMIWQIAMCDRLSRCPAESVEYLQPCRRGDVVARY